MIPSRRQDEAILMALGMLRNGHTVRQVASTLGRHPSNLIKSVRAVLRDDLEYDDPFEVVQHYPRSIIGGMN